MATLYEKVVGCISKPPDDRKESEVFELVAWFCKKSKKIFKSLKPDVVADIIRNCEFSVVKRDEIIVEQGAKGDSFYIILRGEVSVFIASPADQILDQTHGEVNSDGQQVYQETEPRYDELGRLKRSCLGRKVTQLEDGSAFGELALLNDDCIRNASVIADTETVDLAIVSRQLYSRSLRDWQAAELEDRLSFVDRHQLFAAWPIKYRRQLAMSLRRETGLQFDRIVAKQGDALSAMYFIVKGQCKVLANPGLHPIQFPQFFDKSLNHERTSSNSEMNDDGRRRRLMATSEQQRQRNHAHRRTVVEVCLVEENEVIGDIEFAVGLPVFIQSFVCTQPTDVYVLSAVNYERLVVDNRRNRAAAQRMRQLANFKLQARTARLGEEIVPLFASLLARLQAMTVSFTTVNNTDTEVHLFSTAPVAVRKHSLDQTESDLHHYDRQQQQQQQHSRPQFQLPGRYGGIASSNETVGLDSRQHHKTWQQRLQITTRSSSNGGTTVDMSNRNRHAVDDEETDLWLTKLEQRITDWHVARRHDVITKKSPSRPVSATIPHPARLRRLDPTGRKIFPGSRVVIRLRSSSMDRSDANDAAATDSKFTAKGKILEQLERRQSKMDLDVGSTTTSRIMQPDDRTGHRTTKIRGNGINDKIYGENDSRHVRYDGVVEHDAVKTVVWHKDTYADA